MGQMNGVWPDEQKPEFDDVFKESQRRIGYSTAEILSMFAALTPEERAAVLANPEHAARLRMLQLIEDEADVVR